MTTRRWLSLVVLAYLLLGISYMLATPPLEASDEYKHYPLVHYIQHHGGALPVLDSEEPGPWLQEGAQPPLYYALMAGLTAWIDTSDLEQIHQVNAHAFVGNPNQVGNKNLILHQPALEVFPWRGSVLAIYVIRIASILLGAGTVLVAAQLGKRLFGARIGVLAAAFTAFNPMFLFVSAAVNNDSLAILLGHLGLLLLLRLWREAPDPRSAWTSYGILGVVLGIGLLTKLSLGGLLGLSGIALAALSRRRRDWRYLVQGGGLILLVAILIPLPWFIRNVRLYGDPTALNAFIAIQGIREAAPTWRDWVEEFGTFYRSFWGLFGGVNVAAPEVFYSAANLLAAVATAGFAAWGWQQRAEKESGPRGLWLLLVWPLLLFLLLVRWNIISPAFQGRLVFPALGALNVLGAVGLSWWGQRLRRPRTVATVAAGAFLAAAVLPWIAIRPTYAFPKPVVEVPEEARFGPIRFDAARGEIHLVGVQMAPDQSVTPGGRPVEVTLYWQAVQPVARDYLSSVHPLGRDLNSVGAVTRHPAGGMVPTSDWEAGQIWRDDYRVYVTPGAEAPARLQIRVSLYHPAADADLPASGPSGERLPLLTVGEARLASTSSAKEPIPDTRLEVPFSDGISLLGYSLMPQRAQPGDTVKVTLYWQASARPSQNYTIFVHLMDGDGEQLVVADGPPVSGYFPTSYWRAGDMVDDEHALALAADLEPDEYGIAVGLYDPDTGARLARQDGAGDTIFIPITVESR